jgi:uncharacterized HhH-GPD family protein
VTRRRATLGSPHGARSRRRGAGASKGREASWRGGVGAVTRPPVQGLAASRYSMRAPRATVPGILPWLAGGVHPAQRRPGAAGRVPRARGDRSCGYHPGMTQTPPVRLPFTGDPEADALLAEEPIALLVGFLLDQQVSVQKAFSGPLELRRRIGTLDPEAIAAIDPDVLEAAFRDRPALHRFPGNMARRTRELCLAVSSSYGADASRIWREAGSARDLEARLLALPGIGEMKARTLVAILAKRFGLELPGWEDVAPGQPSLADVDSEEALAAYQAQKRARKQALREAGQAGP